MRDDDDLVEMEDLVGSRIYLSHDPRRGRPQQEERETTDGGGPVSTDLQSDRTL